MNHICGFIDVQGYYHEKKFYPREIAVLADDAIICLNIYTGLTYEMLSDSEKQQAAFNYKFKHGLEFESDKTHTPLHRVKTFLSLFYKARVDCDRFLIACKTREAEDVLRDSMIPRINLTDYGATWMSIKKETQHCHLHSGGGEKKCALQIVICLSNWVIRQKTKNKKNQEIKQ